MLEKSRIFSEPNVFHIAYFVQATIKQYKQSKTVKNI